MSKVKFSVIIPAFNCGKYISRAIESVIKQKYNFWEIVIINDGSTDRTKEIVEQFVEQFPKKIILESTLNQGPLLARRKGCEIASGDYLLFLDSDDYLDLECLNIVANILNRNRVDFLSFALANDNGNRIKQTNNYYPVGMFTNCNDIVAEFLTKENALKSLCNKVFSRQLFLSSIPPAELWNQKFTEDHLQFGECCVRASSVIGIDRVLYYYCVNNAESLSHDNSKLIERGINSVFGVRKHISFKLSQTKNIKKEIIDNYNFTALKRLVNLIKLIALKGEGNKIKFSLFNKAHNDSFFTCIVELRYRLNRKDRLFFDLFLKRKYRMLIALCKFSFLKNSLKRKTSHSTN